MLEPGKIYKLKNGHNYPCFFFETYSIVEGYFRIGEGEEFEKKLQNEEVVLVLKTLEIKEGDLQGKVCQIFLLEDGRNYFIFDWKNGFLFERDFEEIKF